MELCPLCGKELKDKRGLHGHFRFRHGKEYGSGREAKKTELTEAVGEIIRKRGEELLAIKASSEAEREFKDRGKGKRKKKND